MYSDFVSIVQLLSDEATHGAPLDDRWSMKLQEWSACSEVKWGEKREMNGEESHSTRGHTHVPVCLREWIRIRSTSSISAAGGASQAPGAPGEAQVSLRSWSAANQALASLTTQSPGKHSSTAAPPGPSSLGGLPISPEPLHGPTEPSVTEPSSRTARKNTNRKIWLKQWEKGKSYARRVRRGARREM